LNGPGAAAVAEGPHANDLNAGAHVVRHFTIDFRLRSAHPGEAKPVGVVAREMEFGAVDIEIDAVCVDETRWRCGPAACREQQQERGQKGHEEMVPEHGCCPFSSGDGLRWEMAARIPGNAGYDGVGRAES